jgi:hypothetical protein
VTTARLMIGSSTAPLQPHPPLPTATSLTTFPKRRDSRALATIAGCNYVGRRFQLLAFFSRNFTASPTVRMVSAASSGISQPTLFLQRP